MKTKFLLSLSLFLFSSNILFAQRSNCAAYPGLIQVAQPDGSSINLYIQGNEVFHYYQTEDGYSILQNPAHNGQFEYATTNADGFMVPSGIEVGSLQKTSFPKYLKPSAQQIKAAYTAFMGNIPANAFQKKSSENIFPSTGKRKLLVVLMQFPDEQTIFSAESFERLMSEEGYSDNSCQGSFRDYYLDNSHGALDLDITVLGWYTAALPRQSYGQRDNQGNSNPSYNSNVQALVGQAIDSAEAAGVDFNDYDNDGDGEMDGLVIFQSGFGAEQGKNGYIWSHRWSLWGGNDRFYDNVSISNYCINPSKRDFNDVGGTTQVRIGVAAHEFGHVLGLPDLYDTDDNSEGAGEWCIMSGGGWLNKESNPCRMNAWCKMEMNWMTPTTISLNGKYNLEHTSDSNIAYRVNTHVSNEFFLLENRQRKKWDLYLPGKGMVIWHIDLNMAENYKLFGMNDVNTDTSMLGVGVIQADGLRELERGINRGNQGDLYPGSTNNTSFSSISNPRSRLHQKDNEGNPEASNVTIVNIVQLADSSIEFGFGGIPVSSFKPSAFVGCAPLSVSFTNLSVYSSGFHWDLGNGQTSAALSPTTTYSQPGSYPVSLIVFDHDNLAIDTFTTTITVSASPVASYSFVQNDTSVIFTNKSTGADFFAWRFGASSSFAVSPTFKFTEPVVFSLIAYSNNGCSDTISGNLWNNGLFENNAPHLSFDVYPNPVKDKATLLFTMEENGPVTITAYDLLGKVVLSETVEGLSSGKQQIAVSLQSITSPGLYYIKLKTNTYEGTGRILKQ